jgi:glycosyltransferase involved in cell wall biosynthesis
MMEKSIPHRIGVQQRVVPAYRAHFFDALAESAADQVGVFAGQPDPREGILSAERLIRARWTRANNRWLGAGKFRILSQRGWREWLAADDPQVVVMEANPRYGSNFQIHSAMRRAGRPVVGWSLGPMGKSELTRTLLRPYYASFDALIVYSKSGAAQFQRIGLSAEHIFVAPNAVDATIADSLLATPSERVAAVGEYSPDHHPVILSVGRLQKRKRVDVLMRACARSGQHCRLLIVGDGPDRARLEVIAAGLSADIRFLGDLRGRALGRVFLAADLFVLPGTGGLALQEALLYGKPVAVAEADGSQADLVRNGENGWFLSPGDEDMLVDVLRSAVGDPDRLRRMGDASRWIVRETATMEKMVAGFLAGLQYCLDSSSQKGPR